MTPEHKPSKSPFQQVTDDLTGGCGCACHTGTGYRTSCEHCSPAPRPHKGRDDGSTHWVDCWRVHHDCAIARVERIEEQLETERERSESYARVIAQLDEQLEAAESKLRALGLAVVDEVLASNPAISPEASEEETTAGSDGTDSGTPDDGSTERLSRPATSSSEASDPASRSDNTGHE